MTQPNILELAKQGNAKAITTLINRQLQPKGITTKAVLKEGCLQIMLESAQVPKQELLVAFIRKGITGLGVKSIGRVKVYGRQTGEEFSAWHQEFDLEVQDNSTQTNNQSSFTTPVNKSVKPKDNKIQPSLQKKTPTTPVVTLSLNDGDTNKSASQSLVSGCSSSLALVLMGLLGLITTVFSLWGIIMLFTGINAGFQGRDNLFCNRIELDKIDCEVIRTGFLEKQSETIQDLQKAEIRITKVRGGAKVKTYSYNYQIFLVTKSGLYTLFYPEDSWEPQNTTIFKFEVSRINNFINNPDKKSIKIEEKEYILSSIKSGVFLLIIGWLPWMIMLGIIYIVLIRSDRQKALEELVREYKRELE